MNPEIKAKWLEKLKSNEYKKGKWRLRNAANQYCCLGVLIDVMDPDKWVATPGCNWAYSKEDHSNEGYELPLELCLKASLPVNNMGELAHLNDNNETFAEVVKYIEDKL